MGQAQAKPSDGSPVRRGTKSRGSETSPHCSPPRGCAPHSLFSLTCCSSLPELLILPVAQLPPPLSLSAPSTSLLSPPQNPSPGMNMHRAAWGFSLNTGVPLSAPTSAVMDIKAVIQMYEHACEYGHILQGIVSSKSVQKRTIWDCLLLIFLIFTPTHTGETSTGNNNWK